MPNDLSSPAQDTPENCPDFTQILKGGGQTSGFFRILPNANTSVGGDRALHATLSFVLHPRTSRAEPMSYRPKVVEMHSVTS